MKHFFGLNFKHLCWYTFISTMLSSCAPSSGASSSTLGSTKLHLTQDLPCWVHCHCPQRSTQEELHCYHREVPHNCSWTNCSHTAPVHPHKHGANTPPPRSIIRCGFIDNRVLMCTKLRLVWPLEFILSVCLTWMKKVVRVRVVFILVLVAGQRYGSGMPACTFWCYQHKGLITQHLLLVLWHLIYPCAASG